MDEWMPIVLALDDETIGKIIFGVIAALIWAISALMSWSAKRQQEARRRAQEELMRQASEPQRQRSRPRIAEGMAIRHPEVLQPPAQQRQRVRQGPPPVPPMRSKAPMPPKPGRKPKPAKFSTKLPPVPPVPAAPLRDLQRLPTPAHRAHESVLSAGAGAVLPSHVPLLSPHSLRTQFAIMEILQPPVTLRADRFEVIDQPGLRVR